MKLSDRFNIFCTIVVFFLPMTSKAACLQTPVEMEVSAEELSTFFQRAGRTVLTFVGYSDVGYEDKAAVLKQAEKVLDEYNPKDFIVNIGATATGIGAVYELAKNKGFVTSGIVSSQAREQSVEYSSCVDHIFSIKDEQWGGFIDGSDNLSPTSEAIVDNSDIIIGIGGGAIARDEMQVAQGLDQGKEVRFIPAEMNHAKAIVRAQAKGDAIPTDFKGAAAEVFFKSVKSTEVK